tara:strand:+ start:598 stop:930 length:333 start_codon:yes stop_codon:yes gene_type:complete
MKLIAREHSDITGITEETWYNVETRELTLKRFQDVEHTLAMNKVLYNEHTSKPKFTDVKDGVYHAARIPLMVIEKWMKEGFNWYKASENEKKAKLNAPEWRHLRVRPGKL